MMQILHENDERYDVQTHFKFGENWADFAQHIGMEKIIRAQEALLSLLPESEWQNRSILDIGCGSGLHALAMLRLGAASVCCVDFDPQSVTTAKDLLQNYAPGENWHVQEGNILRTPELPKAPYDIVYSWGVLHHTGALWAALDHAALYVRPGGCLVIALYKQTPLCRFWQIEKKFYKSAPRFVRRVCETVYMALYGLAYSAAGGNFSAYLRNYHVKRGMNFITDVRDWLGGYPYESATPQDVNDFMTQRGFMLEKCFNTQPMKACGLFGSGCAEYVFRKKD
ncbi:MAG: class I SAM-dependent methyltransferase [Alphaproteobacteria bacterium]|nr:class I SAM-dependent methyltransferase [Alphaproteobacteria bacterium]